MGWPPTGIVVSWGVSKVMSWGLLPEGYCMPFCCQKYGNLKHAGSFIHACIMQPDSRVCYITCTNQLPLSGEQTPLDVSMPRASHRVILLIQQILTFSLCSLFCGLSRFLFTSETVHSCLSSRFTVCLACSRKVALEKAIDALTNKCLLQHKAFNGELSSAAQCDV